MTLVLFNPQPAYCAVLFWSPLPLLTVSRSAATVVKFYVSIYPFSHACKDLSGSETLIPCAPLPLGKTLSVTSTLTPSAALSLRTDWLHFPGHCPFSSTVSCYLSCLGYLCDFPVAVQGSTCLLSSPTLMGTHSLSCCCQVPADLTPKDLPLPLWVMGQGTPSQRKSFSCGFPSASFPLQSFNVLQERMGIC